MIKQIATIETNSFAMSYLRFGNGREPLVIIPGISVQSVMNAADAVVQAYAPLADDFDIYLFDQRKNPPDPYPVREMAQDVCDALRVLELEQVCLFGVSLGGMIAQRIAIEQPSLVRKLALGSTTPCMTDEHYRLLGQWASLAENGDASGLILAMAEAIYPPDMLAQSREQFEQAALTVTVEDLSRFAIVARGTKDFDVLSDLCKIACPVLAIGSTDDQIFGAETTLQIAEHLGGRSDFEMHLYDRYGHACYDLAPDYKDRLLRFFTA